MTFSPVSGLRTLLFLTLVFAFGCEGYDAGTTSDSDAGAKSALGKAHEKAQRTVDQINRYQQDVVRQADTVFDDRAARQLEAERRAGDGGP